MKADLKTLVDAVGGTLLHGQGGDTFQGISIDSRTVREGQLFFCISGPRFDAHDFLREVLEKRVAGVVLSRRDKLPQDLADQGQAFAVLVPDPLKALQDLAFWHRDRLSVRVVGITGTNGKSTTKEMVAGIAATQFNVLKTQGNLNNHIGLPLSVLELETGHDVAVLEMGMSASGEIRRLAEIAQPEIGVITNISQAHMEHLKTLRDVQAAKGELFAALSEKDTAIVNADDPLVLELARGLRAQVITFGIQHPADVRASDIRVNPEAGFDCTLNLFDKQFPLHVPLMGRCNIYNALAAVAAGHSLGIPGESMNEGLQATQPMAQRGELIRHRGMSFFNDTYNANPQSVLQAMDTLMRFSEPGRRFLVLGDMLELGEQSERAHWDLGRDAAGKHFDFLITVGELARGIADGALSAGMDKAHVASFDNHVSAVDYLMGHIHAGDCLLFKGSRGARMEIVLEGLMK